MRTAFAGLRRDRGALALSFVLPIAFFSIFAIIFGGRRDTTPKVSVIVVDEDHTTASRQLVRGLEREGSLSIQTKAPSSDNRSPEYTAVSAEAGVKAGVAPVALVVPHGYSEHPIAVGPGARGPAITMLKDRSDIIAPQVVAGLLQKVAMTSMDARSDRDFENGLISVVSRDVAGESKNRPIVSFYAAAIGVLFLLFTASGAAGSLLEEAESGTLDRVLSSHITMTTLLAGKLSFNALLAFCQLVLMFLWAWAVFRVDFFAHIPGFLVMGMSTAVAVAAFGILLASICRTRAQLGALSTLVILIMSSIGGSMFPRFLMPDAMQKAGLFTINAWAIDGFTKVFWRDQPVWALWPQVAVLIAFAVVFFTLARRFARRWEYS